MLSQYHPVAPRLVAALTEWTMCVSKQVNYNTFCICRRQIFSKNIYSTFYYTFQHDLLPHVDGRISPTSGSVHYILLCPGPVLFPCLPIWLSVRNQKEVCTDTVTLLLADLAGSSKSLDVTIVLILIEEKYTARKESPEGLLSSQPLLLDKKTF